MTTAQAHTDSLPGDPTAPVLHDPALPATTADAADFAAGDSPDDSLGRPEVPDSPAGIDYLAFADAAHLGALPAGPRFRPATAREVFGASSVAVVPAPTFRSRPFRPLTGNPCFQGAVLLLAAAYAILLYRHMADARLLLARVFQNRASGERLAEEPGSSGLARFLKISDVIGLCFIGVAAAKFADPLLTPDTAALLPEPLAAGVSLLFAFLWLVIVAFRTLLLRTAGILTLTQPLIAQLRLLKRTYFALTVIVATPPFLLFALAPPDRAGVWMWTTLAGLASTSLLYLRESRQLFLAKKIPFLHWFLYLCAVEIFPFSFLWLIAVR